LNVKMRMGPNLTVGAGDRLLLGSPLVDGEKSEDADGTDGTSDEGPQDDPADQGDIFGVRCFT